MVSFSTVLLLSARKRASFGGGLSGLVGATSTTCPGTCWGGGGACAVAGRSVWAGTGCGAGCGARAGGGRGGGAFGGGGGLLPSVIWRFAAQASAGSGSTDTERGSLGASAR